MRALWEEGRSSYAGRLSSSTRCAAIPSPCLAVGCRWSSVGTVTPRSTGGVLRRRVVRVQPLAGEARERMDALRERCRSLDRDPASLDVSVALRDGSPEDLEALAEAGVGRWCSSKHLPRTRPGPPRGWQTWLAGGRWCRQPLSPRRRPRTRRILLTGGQVGRSAQQSRSDANAPVSQSPTSSHAGRYDQERREQDIRHQLERAGPVTMEEKLDGEDQLNAEEHQEAADQAQLRTTLLPRKGCDRMVRTPAAVKSSPMAATDTADTRHRCRAPSRRAPR